MYETIRQAALDRCDWKADGSGEVALHYVEAWRYDGVCSRELLDSTPYLTKP